MLSSAEPEWNPEDKGWALNQAAQWLNGFHRQIMPFAFLPGYQNFIDPKETHYLNAYYGQNLMRLKEAKRKYDPQNVFHYGQSVPA